MFPDLPMSHRANWFVRPPWWTMMTTLRVGFMTVTMGLSLMFCCHTDVLETNAEGIGHILESVHKHGSILASLFFRSICIDTDSVPRCNGSSTSGPSRPSWRRTRNLATSIRRCEQLCIPHQLSPIQVLFRLIGTKVSLTRSRPTSPILTANKDMQPVRPSLSRKLSNSRNRTRPCHGISHVSYHHM